MKTAFRYRSQRIRRCLIQSAMTGIMAATLYAGAATYVAPAHAQSPTETSTIKEFKGCATDNCSARSKRVVESIHLWISAQHQRGLRPASELNAALAVGTAGIESHMGEAPTINKGAHKYLFQFVPSLQDPTIQDIIRELTASLAIAKDHIPVLRDIPVLNDDIVMSEKIFSDDIVQSFAFMEYAKLNLKKIKTHPYATEFSPAHVRALIYLRHNLPSMGDVVADNLLCAHPVAMLKLSTAQYHAIHKKRALKKSFAYAQQTLAHVRIWKKTYQNRARNFKANPIIYNQGQYSSAQVLAQISAWQLPYILAAKNDHPTHPHFSAHNTKPLPAQPLNTKNLRRGLTYFYKTKAGYCK